MTYKPLFIYVEGSDDHRFVERIIKPLLAGVYDPIIAIECSKKPSKELRRHINGTKATCSACDGEYWYLLDKDDRPCITATKDWLMTTRGVDNVDGDRVIVVVKEIEAWYLAGTDELNKISRLTHTNDVTKEIFSSISKKQGFVSPLEFMLELIGRFSLSDARVYNESLKYYLERLGK